MGVPRHRRRRRSDRGVVRDLFTGRYPRGIFDFVQSVIRWNNRVSATPVTLRHDRYPPFSLAP